MDETLREFFNEVYEITRQIPLGKVLTYGKIAILAGRPQHARWVGRAMALAPDDTLPCHRVVGSNGSLTGYAGGIERKVRLLALEKADMTGLFAPQKGTAL